MIRTPVKVTIGKLSIKLETSRRTAKYNYGMKYAVSWIDVQEDVPVDIYCEDGVQADEFVGGSLCFKRFSDYYPPVEELISKVKFHGNNWPWNGLAYEEMLMRNETIRDPVNMVMTINEYWGEWNGIYYVDNNDGKIELMHFFIEDKNLSITFSGSTVLHLEASDVGFQGVISNKRITVQMCPSGKCILETGEIEPDYQSGELDITIKGDGELTVISAVCERGAVIPENAFILRCKAIWARSGNDEIEGHYLLDDGVVYMTYADPKGYPELSDWWEQNTVGHLWFEAGNGSDCKDN